MSPRAAARVAGACYLVTIVAGVIAQGVLSEQLIVSGDAAATATNILHHASRFRIGFALYLVEMAAQIAMTVLLYELLKPVSKPVSLLSAVFGLVGCAIKIVSRLFYYAPLLVLNGSPYLNSFKREQLDTLALLFLRVNDQGAAIALAFFGFGTLLKGYLVLRSTFLPRFLGVLAIVGGLGWLTFLWPPLGGRLFPYVAAVGLVGSLATIGWLLAVGVNDERWRAQASAAQQSIWR
jgi:hypothetical protein